MSLRKNIEESVKRINTSFILVFAIIFTSTFFVTVNHAKVINEPNSLSYDLPSKEFSYTFKVGKKLFGNGEIVLSVEKNNIKGTANGIGMTDQCNVDFKTNIDGCLSNGEINLTVNGTGNPMGIPLPGNVKFKGPLKGFLKDEKLSLIGKVNISGGLARLAGFNKKEEILIEIPDSSLVKSFKQLKKNGILASL